MYNKVNVVRTCLVRIMHTKITKLFKSARVAIVNFTISTEVFKMKQVSEVLHTALYVPPVCTISLQVFRRFKPNLILTTSIRAEADTKTH